MRSFIGTAVRCIVLAWFLTAAGCSPLRIAESILLSDDFIRTADHAYGPLRRQRLDVYRPRAGRNPLPVVLFLYGGRWQSGSKEQYRLLGDAFARQGIVTVVPDYRLHPDVSFPAWVEDAAGALSWTRRNVGRFGGDSSRVWVVGHSAGAHTAVLLALDERYLRNAGLPENAVRGYVSIAGPVNTIWTDRDVQVLMGPQQGWLATYPSSFIDDTNPPLLFLHGGDDDTVSPANSVDLAARIAERGGTAKARVYPGVGHVEIVVALSVPALRIAPVMEDIVNFIRAR